MTVGCGDVTAKAADSCECTSLGMYIVSCITLTHTVAESAVLARNRKGWVKVLEDVFVGVGIAQKGYLGICRMVVVETDTTTVHYLHLVG